MVEFAISMYGKQIMKLSDCGVMIIIMRLSEQMIPQWKTLYFEHLPKKAKIVLRKDGKGVDKTPFICYNTIRKNKGGYKNGR
jgi:hypothetical protein